MLTIQFQPASPRQQALRPFSEDGCYLGSAMEQTALAWLAEVNGDPQAAEHVADLLEDYDRALAESEFDAEAPARMAEINDALQLAFAAAARRVLN